MKVKIYTDGACSENPGPGGWGAIFNFEEKCSQISGHELNTTNNRMELKAIIESLNKILKYKLKTVDYELHSDSAYVINAINNKWVEKWLMNGWQTSKAEQVKNQDLWEEFILAKRKLQSASINVSFIKIKGHAGNTFNELADELAKLEVIKAKAKIQ